MSKKRFIAELTKWDGSKEQREIKKSWIEAIVWAIEGQWFFQSRKLGFPINGANYSHVDIYEVAA